MPEEETSSTNCFMEKPMGPIYREVRSLTDVPDSLHDREDPVAYDKKVRKACSDLMDRACPDSPQGEK